MPDTFGGRHNLNLPLPSERISPTPTPYLVHCRRDGALFLTEAEYSRQMWNPDRGWECPYCGGPAEWDDDNYEATEPTE